MVEIKEKLKTTEGQKEKIRKEITLGNQEINYEILNKIKKEDRKL